MIIKGDKREQITPVQFYLDRDLTVTGAEKIINLLASAKIASVEPMAGEAKVSFKITYKVIFSSPAGIDCLEEAFDGVTTVRSASLNPKSVVTLKAAVIANEFVGAAALKVRSTVEVRGYVIVPSSISTPEAPAGVYTKTSPVVVECIEPIRESEIIASKDFEVKEPIDKILTHDTEIIVKRVSTATEICAIQGMCYTYVTYLSGGNLSSRCLATPFDTEILAPLVKEGSSAFCSGEAHSTSLTLADGGVKAEIVIGIKGFSIEKQAVEFMSDCYSKTKELKVGYADAALEMNVCKTDLNEQFSGSVRLAEGAPRIRSILCLCPPAIGAVSVANDAGLAAEGIISVSVVYLADDDTLNEALAEIPFHTEIKADFPCRNGLSANAAVTALYYRLRRNDEIEIYGEIGFEVYGSEQTDLKFIESIEELGEKELNDCAISLYIVRSGEILWDVAKALLSDEQTLSALNPDLKLPLKGGEKVLLYREL
jgi:hypothetical protein